MTELELQEVDKVRDKVPKWFKKPEQINTKILLAYLNLASKREVITIDLLRSECKSIITFDSNYRQMKAISTHNHAKVFHEEAGYITLWKPVENFIVKEYALVKSSLDKVVKNISDAPYVEESTLGIVKSANSKNARYKNTAIGNAQNAVIRNILSNLGNEGFSKHDWNDTKNYFSNCCAYCGVNDDLEMDHAIPINRKSTGEHRLGNLVPSCKPCNKKKASKDFREYLGDKEDRIQKIEAYMDSRGYKPLETNEQVAELLEMAYREVSDVAVRYITIINRTLEN